MSTQPNLTWVSRRRGRDTAAGDLGVANITGARKLSEKTIELSACAQLSQLAIPGVHRCVWFGLTQKQERQYGFDAAANLGGQAFILQFKASTHVLKSGKRKFCCPHHQMVALACRFRHQRNSCFYFLPDLGTFEDLKRFRGDIVGNSFILDVADLPTPVAEPVRKNGYHYAYLDSSTRIVTITSEPFNVIVRPALDLRPNPSARSQFASARSLIDAVEGMEFASQTARETFFRSAVLAVITTEKAT
jgi:hypothetical protein